MTKLETISENSADSRKSLLTPITTKRAKAIIKSKDNSEKPQKGLIFLYELQTKVPFRYLVFKWKEDSQEKKCILRNYSNKSYREVFQKLEELSSKTLIISQERDKYKQQI